MTNTHWCNQKDQHPVSDFRATTQGIRMDLNKVKTRAKDYYSTKGDPLEIQKSHVLKSSTLGRNNKIFQSSFGVVMQPIFPAIKKGCSENRK